MLLCGGSEVVWVELGNKIGSSSQKNESKRSAISPNFAKLFSSSKGLQNQNEGIKILGSTIQKLCSKSVKMSPWLIFILIVLTSFCVLKYWAGPTEGKILWGATANGPRKF